MKNKEVQRKPRADTGELFISFPQHIILFPHAIFLREQGNILRERNKKISYVFSGLP